MYKLNVNMNFTEHTWEQDVIDTTKDGTEEQDKLTSLPSANRIILLPSGNRI